MSHFRLIAGLVCLLLLQPPLVGAAQPDPGSPGTGEVPGLHDYPGSGSACPALDAQSSQAVRTDCCEGHMGVCGCRAGKIVCCDGTTSRTCTCHADSPIEGMGSAVE